ncbi:MAG: TonB-dependent receptor [Nitrospirae bacterium]|nr:TonB-dependent receptor [Nitrospirota bacterium]
MKKLLWIVVCFLLVPSFIFAQDTGIVSGIIIDRNTGEPLIEAGLEVIQTGKQVFTDLDGKFRIELPRGDYEIRVFYPQFQGQRIKNVIVNPGKITKLDISLEPKKEMEIEVVEVVTEADKATEAAQLMIRKQAPAVTDRISAETISKQPDPHVASVVERAPGISVVDDKYVYVRGLGERYTATSLNNAALPSTEPEKKIVPLDLFSSELIESVNIIKSYTPDLPGEFSGGLVQINTKDHPDDFEVKFSLSAGYNTETTGKDFQTYEGGRWDWLAFDDGTRKLPDSIPDDRVRPGGMFGTGYSPEKLEEFGEDFNNIWSTETTEATPSLGMNFSLGDKIGNLGYIISLNYDKDAQTKQEERIYYKVGADNQLEPIYDYDFSVWEQIFTWSGIFNFGYELNSNHKLSLKNLYTRKATDEVRYYEGYNDNLKKDIWNRRLYWKEEGIYNGQISGDHRFEKLKSLIHWRLGYSHASLEEPDTREVLYEYEPTIASYIIANVTQSGSRFFSDLEEDGWDGGFDWEIDLKDLIRNPLKIKFGPAVSYRDRSFDHRRFHYVQKNITGIDLGQDPETLFSPENIEPVNGFELQEETRPTDHYDANHIIAGGYLMADTTFIKNLRFVGGVRVEYSDQEMESFDPFNPSGENVLTNLEDTDYFPSANFIYSLKKDMNLRLGFSQTVNRPEFREIAPFEFTDVHGAYATVGNPELKRALIRNYDLRWEWFLSSDELLAVSLFYKDFDDPIEKVVQPTIQIRSTFQNAEAARNYGFEFELRKKLGFIHSWLEPFNFFANYSYVHSQIELSSEGTEIMTSKDRPLQGQSDHIANLILEHNHKSWNLTTRLLYNYVGERISDVGAFGLPDVIEDSTHWLDLLAIKSFGKWGIKMTVKNLLDQDIKYTQGDKIYHRYKEGITVSFSVFVSNI